MIDAIRPFRRLPSTAALLSAASLAFGWLPAADDEPALPYSLAEAVRMAKADALPRTPLYETPSLAATKPGDLLRKAQYTGYTLPIGARADLPP